MFDERLRQLRVADRKGQSQREKRRWVKDIGTKPGHVRAKIKIPAILFSWEAVQKRKFQRKIWGTMSSTKSGAMCLSTTPVHRILLMTQKHISYPSLKGMLYQSQLQSKASYMSFLACWQASPTGMLSAFMSFLQDAFPMYLGKPCSNTCQRNAYRMYVNSKILVPIIWISIPST